MGRLWQGRPMVHSLRLWIGTVILLASVIPMGSSPAGAVLNPYYPNLRMLKPTLIKVGSPDLGFFPPYDGMGAIRFDTGVLNVGYAAFELVAQPNPAEERAVFHQCTGWQGDVCLGRHNAGSGVWHPGHTRDFHFPDLIVYGLRRILPDGSLDFSPEGLVSQGGRTDTCLFDGGRVERNPDYEPGLTNTSAHQLVPCTNERMRLSSGWLMLLHAHVYQQFLSIQDVPDGDYAITAEVNAGRTIAETSYSDNVSVTKVRLSHGGTQVETLD